MERRSSCKPLRQDTGDGFSSYLSATFKQGSGKLTLSLMQPTVDGSFLFVFRHTKGRDVVWVVGEGDLEVGLGFHADQTPQLDPCLPIQGNLDLHRLKYWLVRVRHQAHFYKPFLSFLEAVSLTTLIGLFDLENLICLHEVCKSSFTQSVIG